MKSVDGNQLAQSLGESQPENGTTRGGHEQDETVDFSGKGLKLGTENDGQQ